MLGVNIACRVLGVNMGSCANNLMLLVGCEHRIHSGGMRSKKRTKEVFFDSIYSEGCLHSFKVTHARLAQSAERKTLNLVVVGSSPTLGEKFEFEFKCDVSRATSGTAQRDLLFGVSLLERIFFFYNRPPKPISFIPAIASTSGWVHSEFVRLLFLQAHRETDPFFSASG